MLLTIISIRNNITVLPRFIVEIWKLQNKNKYTVRGQHEE